MIRVKFYLERGLPLLIPVRLSAVLPFCPA
jgi:hypothetical protein